MILLWTPVHVWAVMLAYREDYLRAGVNLFPLTWSLRLTRTISLALAGLLFVTSLALPRLGSFGLLSLTVVPGAGLLLLLAAFRAFRSGRPSDSFRTFRLSAYPFLGLVFLSLALDTVLSW
jgi:protoheme IX farnesyltransferase